MKKAKTKNLQLSTQNVRVLSADQLAAIAAGRALCTSANTMCQMNTM